MLLGQGLDRYKDDEGVAVLREQVLEPQFSDFAGAEGHMAISLAYGLDGKPRNFREVFDVMFNYFKLKALQTRPEGVADEELSTIENAAKDKAYNRCVRTFRGTSCNIPGVCLTKDIFYRESNIEVWAIMKSDPKMAMKFNVGKYDPANPRHVQILTELGILSEDLERLEQQ